MEHQGKGQIKTIAIKSYKNKHIKGELRIRVWVKVYFGKTSQRKDFPEERLC